MRTSKFCVQVANFHSPKASEKKKKKKEKEAGDWKNTKQKRKEFSPLGICCSHTEGPRSSVLLKQSTLPHHPWGKNGLRPVHWIACKKLA